VEKEEVKKKQLFWGFRRLGVRDTLVFGIQGFVWDRYGLVLPWLIKTVRLGGNRSPRQMDEDFLGGNMQNRSGVGEEGREGRVFYGGRPRAERAKINQQDRGRSMKCDNSIAKGRTPKVGTLGWYLGKTGESVDPQRLRDLHRGGGERSPTATAPERDSCLRPL